MNAAPAWRMLLPVLLVFSSCSYRFYETSCSHPLPGRMVDRTLLDQEVWESSGLLYMGGTLWTFNDSGGEAALYALDPRSGKVLAKTRILGIPNVDWEDIAADSNYVYVADVGNNFATRDTLYIYRISRKDLLQMPAELGTEAPITLELGGRHSLNRHGLYSADCEALLAHGDSLYLFTKDWVEASTSIYVVPSRPGHYRPGPARTYAAGLLVTGADLHPAAKEVILVGYRHYAPVLIAYGFERSPAGINCGGRARIYPLKTGLQVEGICYDGKGVVYVSAEKSIWKQSLFKLAGNPR